MATHSTILAWKIPWTKEPDRLQSMGLQRLGHDRVTEHGTHIVVKKIYSAKSKTESWIYIYIIRRDKVSLP